MSVFGIDLLAMVFGMPRALFPALAERLGGGPALYGLLLSSVAAGAFVASLTSGWTRGVRRQGRAVLWAVAAWGVRIAVAGLTTRAGARAVDVRASLGGADMISGVYRSTIAASVTPDEMRGRVSGVELAVYAGGPVLGECGGRRRRRSRGRAVRHRISPVVSRASPPPGSFRGQGSAAT